MAGDWSGLLPDLLVLIASRIQLVEDFMGFRGVCTAWRADATEDKFLKSWPTVPLLMLAEKNDSDDRELYSLSIGKICMRISVPEATSKKCIESRGWLITLGKSGEISLLHPFSGAQIQLPNLNTLPYYEYYAANCSDSQAFFLSRAVLSSNPLDTSYFVLMVVHSSRLHLGFWRPGDKSWTRIESRKGSFYDVNYYNGKFYAIGYNGHFWVWDALGHDLTVATSSGDLLIVARDGVHYDSDDESGYGYGYGVTKFRVIELDVNKCQWKEIWSIGSNAIFVGHNAAFAIDATRFPDTIKPNCVYFSDDCVEAYCYTENGVGRTWAFTTLKMGELRDLKMLSRLVPFSPPLWVAPSF